jgi:hypothetical protein
MKAKDTNNDRLEHSSPQELAEAFARNDVAPRRFHNQRP